MNWKTFSLKLSDLKLDINEIYLNLGYRGAQPDDHVKGMISQMLEEVSVFCEPQTGFIILEGLLQGNKFLTLHHELLNIGPFIPKYLQNCSHFAVFIATAGLAFDNYCNRFKTEGDILSAYFAYSIGTEIAEAAVRYVSELIAKQAYEMKMGCTHSYSPGHCSWDISEQENLFKIFPENPCGVTLNQSSLMHPEKSVSGIIGLGTNIAKMTRSCETCDMINCFKRK